MRVLVLGSGVIGVTTAYYLRRAGHDVTVIDRRSGPALETSYANAGQISWTYATPWMAPEVPWNALRWMLQRRPPLVLRPRLDPALWRWLALALLNCSAPRFQRNKDRLMRLARYSHACLEALRKETGIAYDGAAGGFLQLFRDPRALASAARAAAAPARWNVRFEVLDREGCVRVEPGLARASVSIAGGIHYAEDETGDCRKFTVALAQRAAAEGVTFLYDTAVTGLAARGGCIEGAVVGNDRIAADACVLAAGSDSPLLLQPLGIRLPVYPLKGYSLTVPVTDEAAAPRSSLTDERYKVGITRLGERIRVAGIAELAGYDLALTRARLDALVRVLEELFPGAADTARAEPWAGLRPMTPDNTPVLGPTPIAGLYLNTGHGTLGWTLSCGSARIVADLVSGGPSGIDLEGLTLERFGAA